MERFVLGCLGLSTGLEAVAIGFVASGVAGLPSLPWVILIALLLVASVATLYWINLHWARMGLAERASAFVIAVGPVLPIAAVMVYIAVIVALVIVATLVIIVLGFFVLTSGGLSGAFNNSHGTSTTREFKDTYGNPVRFDPRTGDLTDRYHNRIGSYDPRTDVFRDAYGRPTDRLFFR
jgi:hypothetical protein